MYLRILIFLCLLIILFIQVLDWAHLVANAGERILIVTLLNLSIPSQQIQRVQQLRVMDVLSYHLLNDYIIISQRHQIILKFWVRFFEFFIRMKKIKKQIDASLKHQLQLFQESLEMIIEAFGAIMSLYFFDGCNQLDDAISDPQLPRSLSNAIQNQLLGLIFLDALCHDCGERIAIANFCSIKFWIVLCFPSHANAKSVLYCYNFEQFEILKQNPFFSITECKQLLINVLLLSDERDPLPAFSSSIIQQHCFYGFVVFNFSQKLLLNLIK